MTEQTTPQVTFYWRPGCPFCSALETALAREGVELAKHNIWEDPDAAATVRGIANGNETVPTVVVGDRAMVNPSPRTVMEALAAR